MGAAEGAQHALNVQPRTQLMTPVEEFSGKDDEDYEQFLTALNSSLTLAGIPQDQRHNYLRLRLNGGALLYFERLPLATRADFAVLPLCYPRPM